MMSRSSKRQLTSHLLKRLWEHPALLNQKKHALRAYTSVLSIFDGQGWNYINDHVVFHLGRLSAHLGNYLGAVQHFRKLITCSHQSPINQAAFLKEFLQAVQSASFDKRKMLLLDLPAINKESTRVYFEDQRTYASVAASMLPDDIWAPLEVGLTPFVRTNARTWLDPAVSKNSTSEIMDYNESMAGETLAVDVEFMNPLQIPLNLSSVSLLCKFDIGSASSKEGGPGSGTDSDDLLDSDGNSLALSKADLMESNREDDASRNSNEQQELSITVVEESITLSSEERHKVQLKVIPHVQGLLCIMGVKWTLSGVVRGYQMFASVEAKTDSRKGKRDMPHTCPPHKRLKFLVRAHMPRLEVSLHGMPEKVNAGELRRVVLELSNTSDVILKNLKFCTGQPGILIMGELEDLDTEFPNCLEVPFAEKQNIREDFANGGAIGSSIYNFPQSTMLEGGSTLLWPLWLHGRETGATVLNSVLYYEASDASVQSHYRTVRMSHSLEVLPSLQVAVHLSPCLLQLEHYLLRLDIANKHDAENVWLRQVSCIGSRWQIAPLLPPVTKCSGSEGMLTEFSQTEAAFLSASVSPSQLLPAGQTLSLFFQLLDVKKGDNKSTKPEFLSNVRLGPPSSTAPLIDVTKGPVSKFHALVRGLKEKVLILFAEFLKSFK
ncbi:hypothetical protein GOP47_0030736 [Adiantum capillus-veneris]|nr:hypothetical protein GOP47_0030736 [Adiantum capillus-veneris]